MAMKSATVRSEVALEGRGLFSGETCRAVITPAPIGSGICFVKDGVGVAAIAENYLEHPNCSVLGIGGTRIQVVEHLLAALWCAGIDSAKIEVTGPELPNHDGSALWQYEQLIAAGKQEGEERPNLKFDSPICIDKGDYTFIICTPGPVLEVNYVFLHEELGAQGVYAEITREYAAEMILPARTFITQSEATQARAAGLLQNDNEQDALVIRDGKPNQPLRFEDEYARHKVLDLLGDLYVLQGELTGRISACRSGHAMNRELARRLGKVQGN